MSRLQEVERELLYAFRRSSTKREANVRSKPILEQVSRDPRFLTDALASYIATKGALDRGNYPTPGITVCLNAYFGIMVNCWIPMAGRETNLSTKAIHHHGNMLLSTVTLHGQGYEHWMFSAPKQVDAEKEIWSMDLLECAPHPQHHVSFVDAHVAHTPFYTKDVSVTMALWSNRFDTTWRDHAKRISFFRGREGKLRELAARLGLNKTLDLKVVEYFDFYPTDEGFVGMKVRKEFEHGPNDDHVTSVFAVLAATGNHALARNVRDAIDHGLITTGRKRCEELLPDLERGRPIDGRLSKFHYELPFANFTREQIHRALKAQSKKKNESAKRAVSVGA